MTTNTVLIIVIAIISMIYIYVFICSLIFLGHFLGTVRPVGGKIVFRCFSPCTTCRHATLQLLIHAANVQR